MTFRELGNLVGEGLVPEFPAKLSGKLLRDLGSARSVFPLDGDGPDRQGRPPGRPLILDAAIEKNIIPGVHRTSLAFTFSSLAGKTFRSRRQS